MILGSKRKQFHITYYFKISKAKDEKVQLRKRSNCPKLFMQLHLYEVEVDSDSKLICSWWQKDSEFIWLVRDAWDQAKSIANLMIIHVHYV